MVNSRQKGKVGEKLVKEFLEKNTPYTWEYTPGSGSGVLKGDLIIPKFKNTYVIEVKNYADSPISDKILTAKTDVFLTWWHKLGFDCLKANCKPLLFFRYNRSKLFVATRQKPANVTNYLAIGSNFCYIMLAEEWIGKEKIEWLIS